MVNVLEVLRNFIRYAPESVVAYLLASGLISGMDLIFSSHSLVIASDVGMRPRKELQSTVNFFSSDCFDTQCNVSSIHFPLPD